MLKFIKAELFRLRKDKFMLLVFAFVFFGYASNTLLATVGDHCTRFSLIISSWQTQYYFILKLSVFLLCYIWSQEFRYETLKNVFSTGNGIEKFYSAKVIIQFIVCMILFIWALLCYILFFVMLPKGNSDISIIILERLKGFGMLLLYSFAEISFMNLIYTIIKKEMIMFILYFFVIDKIGDFISGITNISLFKSISIGNGYEKSISIFIDIKERMLISFLMLGYVLIVNVIMYLLLKKGKLLDGKAV